MCSLKPPDEVLKEFYEKNTLKLIRGIDASTFPP
jgi:hypothetical protein